MKTHPEMFAAISAEIRAGECSQRAIESLQQAFEQDLVCEDEMEYLQGILEEESDMERERRYQ